MKLQVSFVQPMSKYWKQCQDTLVNLIYEQWSTVFFIFFIHEQPQLVVYLVKGKKMFNSTFGLDSLTKGELLKHVGLFAGNRKQTISLDTIS